MTHTKEPWSINEWTQPDDSIAIGAVGTPLIARVMSRDSSLNEQKANARRIVACINACTNIETEVLEQHHLGVISAENSNTLNAINRMARPGDVANLVLDRDKLLLQRNALLHAAQNIRDVKGRFHTQQAMEQLLFVLNQVEEQMK